MAAIMLILACSAAAASTDAATTVVAHAAPGQAVVRFVFPGIDEAARVEAIGTFNSWRRPGLPLQKFDNVWAAETTVPAGKVHYKFVVDEDQYHHDAGNPISEPDGFGGRQSVLQVDTESLWGKPAQRGDGRITTAALQHDPESVAFLNAIPGSTLEISLHTRPDDIEFAVVAWNAASEHATPHSMELIAADGQREVWRAEVPHPTSAKPEQYSITVVDGDSTASAGTWEYRPADSNGGFQVPPWAEGPVWYNVFPERFRNGSAANDPDFGVRPWIGKWTNLEPRDDGSIHPSVFFRRYGGDLPGVDEKLTYLHALGVGGIWLNPVFQSPSLHKYDAADFRHVDTTFGAGGKPPGPDGMLDPATWGLTDSDRVMLDMMTRARGMGLRIVADAVFNHSSDQHPAFLDAKARGEKSPFYKWYAFTSSNPPDWEGWGGNKGLPVFREDENGFVDSSLRDHLFAVTRKWMDPNGDGDPSDGVDGWRLDAANEVSPVFWREWRQLVKSINPDAVIIGEVWEPAQEWLAGDMFDGVMNYQFGIAVVEFLANGGSPSAFDAALGRLRADYPRQARLVSWNLVDSHDTDRIASRLMNPGRPFDRENQVSGPRRNDTYDDSRPTTAVFARLRTLATLQYACEGAPMVYYGTEAGMWGADDPHNRKPMLWKDLEPYEDAANDFVHDDMLSHYRWLGALRAASPALRTGRQRTLLVDDQQRIYAFTREADDDAVLFVLNDDDQACEPDIMLPEDLHRFTKWVRLRPGAKATAVEQREAGRVTFTLEARDAAVIVPAGRVDYELLGQ